MERSKPEPPRRGRFGNVIHRDDVETETYWQDKAPYGAASREVAVALGAKDLGYCIVTLAPGKRSCPYHFHHSEEEVFFVLEGSASLRQGDSASEEEVQVRAGDFVSYPAGTGIAHQFTNTGTEPFVYLAMSNRLPHDIAEYPDSNKILVRATRHMLRREPRLDYFDGEL